MSKIRYLSCLVLALYSVLHTKSWGQEHLIDKIKDFIPEAAITYNALAFEGDLNRDAYADIIVRYKLESESEYIEHMYLFTGQENSTYTLATKNDTIELDFLNGCGFDTITIDHGSFSIEYSGYGNTSGSYSVVTFKYSEEDKDWFLFREALTLVHRYADDGPYETETTEKDFGRIWFKDYNSY